MGIDAGYQEPKKENSWTPLAKLLLAAIGGGALWLAICQEFGALPIEQGFGWASTLEFLAPLALAAIVVERAVEVFLFTWQGEEKTQRNDAVKQAAVAQALAEKAGTITTQNANALTKATGELDTLKAKTVPLAAMIALALGICISAAGFRIFAHMMVEDSLAGAQRMLFIGTDVLLSGALIGGGADPIHKVISLFKAFMQTTRDKIESQKPMP